MRLPVEDQAYWLLKYLAYNGELTSENDEPNRPFKKSDIEIKGFTSSELSTELEPMYIACTEWLLNYVYIDRFPKNSEYGDQFHITEKGLDFIDIDIKDSDSISRYIGFEINVHEAYEVTTSDVVSLLYEKRLQKNSAREYTFLSVNLRLAEELSNENEVAISLRSLQRAAVACESKGLIERLWRTTRSDIREYRLTEKGFQSFEENGRLSLSYERDILPRIDRTVSTVKESVPSIDEKSELADMSIVRNQSIDVYLTNQAFLQSIDNIRSSLKVARRAARDSNQLKIENEELQKKVLDYLDHLEKGMDQIVLEVDLGYDPIPVQENQFIKKWLEDNWPEAIAKADEFTSKQALADILIPAGFVAALAVGGGVVGSIFGVKIAITGIGVGAWIGMFATRQVTTKDATKEIKNSFKDDAD